MNFMVIVNKAGSFSSLVAIKAKFELALETVVKKSRCYQKRNEGIHDLTDEEMEMLE